MVSDKKYLAYLWQQYIAEKASRVELDELFSYIRHAENDDENVLMFQEYMRKYGPQTTFSAFQDETWEILTRLTKSDEKLIAESTVHQPTVHRVISLKRTWLRYAVILLLIAGTATVLYTENKPPKKKLAVTQPAGKPDILPAGNKAVLTLSDGSTIMLDSAANGILADQGNTKIVKFKSGMLAYQVDVSEGAEILYNTISTPRGGQYQIQLPDGSNVWLNAASSIRFPTRFGKERTVQITGEAYFEIVSDKSTPFLVHTVNTEISVLGTSFNVNAYEDESVVNTTLLSGSVRVAKGDKHVVLKPGQSAQVFNSGNIQLDRSADLQQVMAWRNGLFKFRDADIKKIMRQIEKWYEVEVIFKDEINTPLTGTIPRNLTLSNTLKSMEGSGAARFRLEGKKVIVTKY